MSRDRSDIICLPTGFTLYFPHFLALTTTHFTLCGAYQSGLDSAIQAAVVRNPESKFYGLP